MPNLLNIGRQTGSNVNTSVINIEKNIYLLNRRVSKKLSAAIVTEIIGVKKILLD